METVKLSDNVTIIHGDCQDWAGEADAVISDPPYGMDWNPDSTRFSGGQSPKITGGRKNGRAQHRVSRCDKIEGDSVPFDPGPWLEYKHVALWGANHFGARLPVGTTLVWIKRYEKLYGSFLSDAELAWVKGGHGVYCRRKIFTPPTRAVEGGGTGAYPVAIHPNQKPIEIMAWCMDKAKVPEGATVLDPYMGSGTTGIACIRTGRRFVGIEIDTGHFATARKRLERELAQGRLPLEFDTHNI